MQRPLSALILLLSLLLPSASVYAQDDPVEKTYCTQGIAYDSIDALKLDLLNNAKKAVINELFGEFIVASTAVENFVVTKDQIQTSSIGFVRVKGTTDFHNGKDFADVCITVRAYVTAEDREKFEPEKLEKKYCDADDNLTAPQLTAYVRREVIIQAVLEYEPKLKEFDPADIYQLVKKINYIENGFIPDTQTYCSEFEGYIVPVEVMAFLQDDTPVANENIHNDKLEQWVVRVPGFSSQYGKDDWSANQVVGEPDVQTCGDSPNAWTAKENNTGTHFVEVEFEQLVLPEKLFVRQTNAVGFVSQLDFLDLEGSYHPITVVDHLSDCPGESEFDLLNLIDFPTKQIRIHINTSHNPDWEAIDAVLLSGTTVNAVTDSIETNQHAYIDFESIPEGSPSEGLRIGTQFVSKGVSFVLENGSLPVLAATGGPKRTGFESVYGLDTAQAGHGINEFFLTDDGIVDTKKTAPAILINFEQTVSSVGGVVLDVEESEIIVIEAQDAFGKVVQTITINGTDKGSGDGLVTPWLFERTMADISLIRIDATTSAGGGVGFGIDNIHFGN